MLIPLNQLVKQHKISRGTRVIHVGAHEAQEAPAYKQAGFSPVIWIEGNESIAEGLIDKIKSPDIVINAVLSNEIGEADFNITSFDQSSSLLPFGTHSKHFPEIVVDRVVKVNTLTLDCVAEEFDLIGYEFLNLDVQGAEWLVLEGGKETLSHVRYLYAEVNKDEQYMDCMVIGEFDNYVGQLGFKRENLKWSGKGFGDAFYVRQP